MKISLRKIDRENWRECLKLKVKDSQRKFVGTNENSFALAYVHKELKPRAIFSDNVMVGFLMYGKDPDTELYYINRLMIDEKYQGNGYGKEALKLLISKLKKAGIKSVDILHSPENESAIKIYRELGFLQTNLKLKDDDISSLYF